MVFEIACFMDAERQSTDIYDVTLAGLTAAKQSKKMFLPYTVTVIPF